MDQTQPRQSSGKAPEYEYDAFISYKHEDMEVATLLQDILTKYRTALIPRKKYGLPKSLQVFLDKTAMVSGCPLPERIKKSIRQSRSLIVLCSRHTKHEPEWVNLEIDEFIHSHGYEGIIPFIIDPVSGI